MDRASLRILDANFNRAREALRVVEDYARFVLNDAAACGAIKQLRHELADVTRGFRGAQHGVAAASGWLDANQSLVHSQTLPQTS